MRENADQKNSRYRHVLRSDGATVTKYQLIKSFSEVLVTLFKLNNIDRYLKKETPPQFSENSQWNNSLALILIKVPANTSEKMEVFARDFLSKCKQIRSFLRSCSYTY